MYFSVHNHDDTSNIRLLDCIIKPKELVNYARELNLKGVCITSHECLSSHMEYNEMATQFKNENIDFKIGLGNEIYLVDERKPKQKYYHLILLAKDKIGHEQLRILSSKAWYHMYNDRKMDRVPTLKSELKEVVESNPGHLICTTACRGSELGTNLWDMISAEQKGDMEAAKNYHNNIVEYMLFLKGLFGDDFYVECAPNKTDREQNLINIRSRKVAEAFGVKMIYATDSHYLREEDRYVHEAFLNSKGGERETASFYKSSYMMSYEEVKDQLSVCFEEDFIEEMTNNTLEIMNKIEYYNLKQKQKMMALPVNIPNIDREYFKNYVKDFPTLNYLFNSSDEQELFWVSECLFQLKNKNLLNQKYLSRLEEEADIIKFVGDDFGTVLFRYFNNLNHFIDYAWEVDSIIGVGRGSATCYLSNYLLGITQLDPVVEDLPLWRFLNKGNIGEVITTDIDIDLNPLSRNAFINKIKEEVGEINCVAVGAFGTVTTKSAINIACRGYRNEEYPDGIDNDIAQYLSSMIPSERGFLWSVKDAVFGNKEKDRKPVVTLVRELKKYPRLLDIILGIEGLIDKRTRHAAGVVISDDMLKHCSIMRTPSGEIISSYSLYPLEDAGLIKWDFLVTDACSKLTTALKMLQEYNQIPKEWSLKEAYYNILEPTKIDKTDKKLWDRICSTEVMDLFQFNSNVGLLSLQKTQPRNVIELTAANAVMRLQAEKGGEAPLDRFERLKGDINLWYAEMHRYGLTSEEINILEPYYLPYNGCICLQESLMQILMDERICGFTLSEANKARKVVSKKQMAKIPELKEKVFNSIKRKEFGEYVWDTAIKPQLGYSFSLPHCLGYGWIAMQEAYLTLKFPQIFWNTTCLCINAGTLEEVEYNLDQEEDDLEEKKKKAQGVNYGKIAKALGKTLQAGINIAPPNINTASKEFKPDVDHNRILYSLKAISGIGDNEIEIILNNRPFNSFDDFLNRVKMKKTSVIALVKSGAFDELEKKDRIEIMKEYISIISEPKSKLNLQNFKGLIDRDMIPEDLDFYRRLFNFNKYIRQKQFKTPTELFLDEVAQNFMRENYQEVYEECTLKDNNFIAVNEKRWKKVYDKEMNTARNWLKNNQEELLNEYNKKLFNEQWEKYCLGTISKWEMDSMSYYWHDHELEHIQERRYGVSNFSELPEEPIIDKIYNFNGREVPTYKITKIVGTCIDKNNTKGTFTLLTPDGEVVDIRLSNEHYALYNKQISEVQPDGSKKVKEKSWFSRGNKLMVVGFRRGSNFVPKKYKSTPEKHRLFLITDVNEKGEMLFTSARYGAEE